MEKEGRWGAGGLLILGLFSLIAGGNLAISLGKLSETCICVYSFCSLGVHLPTEIPFNPQPDGCKPVFQCPEIEFGKTAGTASQHVDGI